MCYSVASRYKRRWALNPDGRQSASAGAATWVEIGSSDSVVVFVDKDSLRRNGSKVRSWLKWEWAEPVEVPNVFPIKRYR